MNRVRTVILGAAGRDFHNFNVVFRDAPAYDVIAFTAQQIPHIAERTYPADLTGVHYPCGIPIHPEDDLEELIRDRKVDLCVLAYSDLSHEAVGHIASRVNAAGADFTMLGVRRTVLHSSLPVVSVCASRTGAGKSQTSRAVVRMLRNSGLRVGVLRHPMPYGDLARQRVQRFTDAADLEQQRVTFEEREEYEPHIAAGSVVWAGVDYSAILHAAEREADVIVWDGGNNDTSFLHSDLLITVVDPHRVGHELRYYPGETNVRLADLVIINKVDTADPDAVRQVRDNVRSINAHAEILEAESPIEVADPAVLRGRLVLAVEDGPTLTHGGMTIGAAMIGAQQCGATLMDPRPHAQGELVETLRQYPHIVAALPAMGYGDAQVRDMESTIAAAVRAGAAAVAVGTPIDLAQLIDIPVPHTRVGYSLRLRDEGALARVLTPIMQRALLQHEVDVEC
ncbi:cyclic 2,3-diphosphoglycerate synthase [soil metagenome]